jgi:membrane-bound lytic murein transglycosylase B
MRTRYWRLLITLLWALALLTAHVYSVPPAHAAQSATPPQNGRTPTLEFMKSLQRELKRAGYDPGRVDGKMGPSTRGALKRFQEAHGLSPSGDPDIPTLTKLLGQSLQQDLR